MDGTDENDSSTAFIQADPDEVKRKLVCIIRQVRPNIIITFEPFGWCGHPDHIATGRYTTEAFYLAGDTHAFLETGISWLPQRLYHAAMPLSSFKTMLDYARAHDIDISGFEDVSVDKLDSLLPQITHELDVRALMDIKDAATICHPTQFGEDSLFRQLPPEMRAASMGTEYFIQVEPPLETGVKLKVICLRVP